VRVSLSNDAQADADAAIDWYIGEGALIAADDFADERGQALGLPMRACGSSPHAWRTLLEGFRSKREYSLQRFGRQTRISVKQIIRCPAICETVENQIDR
jgi:hypothetical protein